MSEEQIMFPLAIEEPRFCGLLRLRDRVERLFGELQELVAIHRAEAWGFDSFEDVVELAEAVTDADRWNTGWMRIRASRISDRCKGDAFWPSQRDAGRAMARLIGALAHAVDELAGAERFEIERARVAA